jgi:hypothetical protein
MNTMWRNWQFAICGLLVPAALGAQTNQEEPAISSRYTALVGEYEDARRAYNKDFASATTDTDRSRIPAKKPDPAEYARRFLALAESKPGDKEAWDALSWVLTHTPHTAEGDKALEILATDHLDDPRLGPILQRLGSSQSTATEKLLRAALEKSQDREIQAHACYVLAMMLTTRERQTAPVRHRANRSKKSQLAPPEANSSVSEEIEVLYGRLLKDFREIKPSRKSRKTYGEIALEALERIKLRKEHAGPGTIPVSRGVGLELGMVAPPIDGFDTNGRSMRLADFRGKVVVLDFWGDW